MRIAYPFEHASLMGGSQHSLLDMVTQLSSRGVAIAVYCPPGGPVAEAARAAGAIVKTIGAGERWRFSPRAPISTLRDLLIVVGPLSIALRRQKPEIIHCNNAAAVLLSWIAMRVGGVKASLLWHDRGFARYPRWLIALARVLGRQGQLHVLCTTEGCREEWLRQGLPAKQLNVIYNGIDDATFFPRSKASSRGILQLSQSRPVVAVIARLSRNKGHVEFFHALRMVADHIPDILALLIGDVAEHGSSDHQYRQELMGLVERLHLGTNVRWLGAVPNHALPDVLGAADIVVNPAPHESFGRALVEGMLMGLPVVAANDGGPREVLGQGSAGVLVPPGNSAELCNAMLTLLTSREVSMELGRKGRQRALELFTLKESAMRIERFYKELVNTPINSSEAG